MDNSSNSNLLGRGALSRRDLLRGIGAVGLAAMLPRFAPAAGRTQPGAPAGLRPVRFAVLGDWGNGDDNAFRIAERMAALHDRSTLDLVMSAGDNIYPNGEAKHFAPHFERPFDPVLSRKVPFYTCLGNHDVRRGAEAQMRYPLFNMGGLNYYTIQAGGGTADFFVLDTNDLDRRQLSWLEGALSRSTAVWKIAVFHHPPFSSAKSHGSDEGLQRVLHPVLARGGVHAVFNGHDHVYQRVTPQDGVQYFVSGAGGKVRPGDLRRGDRLVAAGYDDDSHFMAIEADATALRFRAIAVDGRTVDQGSLAATAPRRSTSAA